VTGQVARGVDDRLAGEGLDLRAGDRHILERGRFELALDAQGQQVADLLEAGQRLVGGQVLGIPRRVALDRRGVGLEGIVRELGPSFGGRPSRPRCLTPGPTKPT
jgi:hypothetical protein